MTVRRGQVRTVRGEVEAGDLGVTYSHEHLVTNPGFAFRKGDDDLVLDDHEAAARDLTAFSRAGGGTVVEVSCAEFGRDTHALADLSIRTGVHIVAATGHVVEAQWAGVVDLERVTEEDLTREMLRDLDEGFPEAPDVRAGIIKVGTSRDGATPTEERVLRAAAAAQHKTGVAITTHTTGGTAPLEQIGILESAGADLDRVCIGHQDLRLVPEDHLAIVRAGCFIGFDSISKEKHQSDADRIDAILGLVAGGHGHAICLSGDFARRSNHLAYGGGPGLPNILSSFVPRLREAGVGEVAIEQLLVANPARLLGG